MKKIHIFLMLAFALVTSCAKDPGVGSTDSDVTSITVQLSDDGVATRTTVDLEENDLRLFLMVNYGGVVVDQREVEDWDGGSYTWDLRLGTDVSGYTISAWADFGSEYYTVVSDIDSAPSITMNTTDMVGNTDMMDSYYATADITASGEVALTMKRPLAMMKVYSPDCGLETVYNAGFVPTTYNVSFDAKESMDLITGLTYGDVTVSVSGSTGYTAYQNLSDDDCLLSYVYVLADEVESTIDDIQATYYSAEDATLVDRKLNNIPFKRNYITNITGNLVTQAGTITVTLDQEWLGTIEDKMYSYALEAGQTYDIVITQADLEYYVGTTPASASSFAYIFTGGGEGTQVNISFESDAVAEKVLSLLTDFTGCNDGVSFNFNGGTGFVGDITIGDYYDTFEGQVLLDNLDIYMPNGSGSLTKEYSVNNLTVSTADATFIIEEGASVNTSVVVNAGRVIIEGTSTATINVNNGSVWIPTTSGYDIYATSSLKSLYYTETVGAGLSLSSILEDVGVESTYSTFTDMIDLGLDFNYSGVVGFFGFNNSNDGFNAHNWRNVMLSVTSNGSEAGTAKLKAELDLSSIPTAAEIAEMLNMSISEFQAALLDKSTELSETIASLEAALPAEIYSLFGTTLDELQTAVQTFVSSLPTSLTITDGDGIPVGTIIPDEDNFKISNITSIIGTPDDEFDISNISSYLDGSETFTLYMLVNFVNDIVEAEEEVAAIQAEIDALEAEQSAAQITIDGLYAAIETDASLVACVAEFTELVAEYEALEAPESSGKYTIYGSITGTWYIISPSYDLSLTMDLSGLGGTTTNYQYYYYSLFTSSQYGSDNSALMSAKNSKLDEIYTVVTTYQTIVAENYSDTQTQIDVLQARIEEIGSLSYSIDAYSNDILQTVLDGIVSAIIENLVGTDMELPDDFIPTYYFYDGELEDLYSDLFTAQIMDNLYSYVLETIGVTDDMISVFTTIADYLEDALDVITAIDEATAKIDEYNPWEYSYTGDASIVDGVNGASVSMEFEYTPGYRIYVNGNEATVIE